MRSNATQPKNKPAPFLIKKTAGNGSNELQMQPRRTETAPVQMQPKEGEEEMVQMQATEEEEEELQMQSAEETTTDNTTNTIYCNRPLPQSEVGERNRILADFTRGLPDLDESVRRVLISSICDFSLNQLNMMREAGLRFWIGSGVPPVFEGAVQRSTTRGSASYARAVRTIFLGRSYMTHEMAHAWDHIRNLSRRQRVRLDNISNIRHRRNLITSPGEYLTETDRPQDIQIDDRSMRTRFSQMHAAYNRRVPRRELAFSGSSRLGYSRTDPQEFYAEGYTVFHGNSANQQAKLYKYARELYAYLLAEAIDQQMPAPDIDEVRREARQLQAPR